MARKREAVIEHLRLASSANHDRRLLVATNAFSTTATDDARVLASQVSRLDNEALTTIRNEWRSLRTRMESASDFFGLIADDLGASQTDRLAGAIRYIYEVSASGAVTISERRGILGALYRDMELNSKSVLTNGVTFGSLTAASGNRGALTSTAMTGLSHTLTGTAVFEVVSEDVSTPQIRVTLELTNPTPDNVTVVKAENFLTPEQSFEDGPTGFTITLTRSGLASPTETDPSSLFASTSFATPGTGDSDNGVYHFVVSRVATSPIWQIEVYSDSSDTTKVGVPNATVDGTSGTQVLTIDCDNGTVITTTFSKTNAAGLLSAGQSDSSVSYDIETPRLGDRWTRTVTNDEAANFQTKLSKLWRVSLPVSGSPTFTDSNASSISMS